jgi:purine-binding chemotaxis protein CheW
MAEGMVLFKVAGATYAVRSESVVMVEMISSITRVPHGEAFLEGVTAVRGQVIPVVSLRKRFDMETVEFDLQSRLVVIRVNNRMIGMLVDSAREYIKVENEQILPPPEALTGPDIEYLEGVIMREERLILLINMEKLFDEQERVVIADYADEKISD